MTYSGSIKISLLVLLLLVVLGCSKHEDPTFTTYDEELLRFIYDSETGQELFSTDLYSEDPFYFDSSSKLYFYKIDTVDREIQPILIANEPKNIHPYFSSVYDSRVEVLDIFYGNMYSIDNDDTMHVCKVIDSLTRYAYFVKLYNDSYEYHGWYFWGYSGGKYDRYVSVPPRKIEAENSNEIFSGGRPSMPIPNPLEDLRGQILDTLYSYIDTTQYEPFVIVDTVYVTQIRYTMGTLLIYDTLTQDTNYYLIIHGLMPKLSPYDSLTFTGVENDRIFTRTSDDSIRSFNAVQSGSSYKTGWKIPSSGKLLNNLIFFDVSGRFDVDTIYNGINMTIESTLLKDDNYVIPYQIRQ